MVIPALLPFIYTASQRSTPIHTDPHRSTLHSLRACHPAPHCPAPLHPHIPGKAGAAEGKDAAAAPEPSPPSPSAPPSEAAGKLPSSEAAGKLPSSEAAEDPEEKGSGQQHRRGMQPEGPKGSEDSEGEGGCGDESIPVELLLEIIDTAIVEVGAE